MGDLAAQWFSDFPAASCAWCAFDPEQRRLADRRWTGLLEAEAPSPMPLRCWSRAAPARRTEPPPAAAGHAPVTMQRFRPNLVPDGLDANGEDHPDEIVFGAPEGPVRLKLPVPRARRPHPRRRPGHRRERGHVVGDALAAYISRCAPDGAITFGMNAVIVEGVEATLRIGMVGRPATPSRESRPRPGSCSRSACSSGTTRYAITWQIAEPAPESAWRCGFALAGATIRLRGLARRAPALFGAREHAPLRAAGRSCMACPNCPASTTPSSTWCRGWWRWATGLAADRPLLGARAWFGAPLSGRFLAGGLVGLLGVALIFWPEIARAGGGGTDAGRAVHRRRAVLLSAVAASPASCTTPPAFALLAGAGPGMLWCAGQHAVRVGGAGRAFALPGNAAWWFRRCTWHWPVFENLTFACA